MNTRPTPISDRIVCQFRKGEATSDGLILTMEKLERELNEARDALAEIEDKMRVELGGHPNSKLWGEAGLIAATMRCVDALGEATEQRDEARKWSSKLADVGDDLRAEIDEAREELSEWRILNGWGGTPEIINDFIKGQQTRIHHAQDLEAELTTVTTQRDKLAEALREWAEIREWLEIDPYVRGYMKANLDFFNGLDEALQSLTQNVKGHASPEHAPKIDQTASSASHVPPCSLSSCYSLEQHDGGVILMSMEGNEIILNAEDTRNLGKHLMAITIEKANKALQSITPNADVLAPAGEKTPTTKANV